ncbi:hypothetical protein J537_0817 [Acinetobacter baumannii 1437282]|nr:hypothetical protein J537_0817 [Acinetobacter baumannii 1437282]
MFFKIFGIIVEKIGNSATAKSDHFDKLIQEIGNKSDEAF